MKTILFERALSFEERPFDVLDLVLAGLAEATWPELEADAAAGVAAEQELDARGAGPSLDEVQKAERAFRYERGLLAAADLEQWLAARRLARGEWRGVLRRVLAREWLRPTAAADAGSLRARRSGISPSRELARTTRTKSGEEPTSSPSLLSDSWDEISEFEFPACISGPSTNCDI